MSTMAVPLGTDVRVFGALVLSRQEGRPFTTDDLRWTACIVWTLEWMFELQNRYLDLETRAWFADAIVDSLPVSLVVFDRQLRVVSVNRNFLDKARRELRVTVGRRADEVLPRSILSSTRLVDKVYDLLRTGEGVQDGRFTYRAPGVPPRVYFYRLVPLKRYEEVGGVMLLIEDITEQERLAEERRLAERHLASVVECANELVVSLTTEGRIVTWNHAAEARLGFTAEEAMGRLLSEFCAEGDREIVEDLVRRAGAGETVRSAEASLLTRSGERALIAWSSAPMHNDAGQVVGIVTVGRDLTDQRRLQAQLLHAAKMASLGVMAGGIAHELRNPLAIASAATQLLLEQPQDDRLRTEALQKIQSSIRRASAIIENLLMFARPGEARMELVEMNTLVQETLHMLAHQLALHRVTLHIRLGREELLITGNRSLLQQVLTNLVLNACNAMPDGGSLTVATSKHETGQVRVEISDTGCGIPPEHLPKIFDPFFTTMPPGKGTGLGLAISYSIVREHGGTIDVQSEVGRGTTVVLTFPPAA
jgi:PAS domain S-box-containing protein